jgi:uncharacterized protein
MPAPPPFAIRDNPEKHRFELDFGDGSFAIAEYTLPAGKIVFTHTEVPPAHEGQGIGSALVRFALRSARDRGLKVIPICPFVAAYIKKHEEEQDLLDPAHRKALAID